MSETFYVCDVHGKQDPERYGLCAYCGRKMQLVEVVRRDEGTPTGSKPGSK